MSLRFHLIFSYEDPGNEDLCARGWVRRCSCLSPRMEGFSLDLPEAVKKRCTLEVGCGGVWNCGRRQNNFLTL